MDGLIDFSPTLSRQAVQSTLAQPIDCVGVGLHSGAQARLTLAPGAPGAGIVFRRTDLGVDIPARFDHVAPSRLCTVLQSPTDQRASVATVEHLLAAFAGMGIDNAIVSVDGPELPILDGSAAPFVFLIDCAGRTLQAAPRAAIEVLRPVRVEDGESFIEIRPGAMRGRCLSLSARIDFPAAAIGRQALSLTLSESSFRNTLAAARTFTLAGEIAALREAGLARGGSLGNAIVVDEDRVLNPEGLRTRDEFVRHKLLDMVGDLSLAAAPLLGRVVANRPGHALNNRLLHALFADPLAWRSVVPQTWAAESRALEPGALEPWAQVSVAA